MTSPSESAADIFSHVAVDMLLMHPDDEQGTMFHSPGLKTRGKFYVFTTKGYLVLKLPAERVTELIEAGSGEPCSPRPGRPMREWVQIPIPDEAACKAYLLESRAFVVSLA